MTPREEFYLKMGFLDCLQMYAQAAPNPDQAITKRMYIQDQMIPDTLPGVSTEEILHMIDDIIQRKITETMVLKYIKPKTDMQKMLDILKKSKFTSIYDLK